MKANEKIQQTAIAMRSPKDDAEAPELALSTLVQGLSAPAARGYMEEAQESGDLDQFLETLARWIIGHRSDGLPLLVVVELPPGRHRTNDGKWELEIPAGTILKRVGDAFDQTMAGPPDLAA